MASEGKKPSITEIVLPHDEADKIARLTDGYLNSVPVDIEGRSFCVLTMTHETAGEQVVVIFGVQEMTNDACEE